MRIEYRIEQHFFCFNNLHGIDKWLNTFSIQYKYDCKEKPYNSIARSFKSKPSLLIFFSKNGRLKKLKQKPGERHPSRIFSQQQSSLKYDCFEPEILGNI